MKWNLEDLKDLNNVIEEFFKDNGYRIGSGCFCSSWRGTRSILWDLESFILSRSRLKTK